MPEMKLDQRTMNFLLLRRVFYVVYEKFMFAS